ncbi:MAG: PDZ domain-containing protein [Chitinophagales bacterium]
MRMFQTFQLLAVCTLMLGVTFATSAQEQADENRKATIKIVKEVDGKTTTIDRMIELQKGESLEDALQRTGLDKEIEGIHVEGKDIDIDVDIEMNDNGTEARKMKKMIFIGEDGETQNMKLEEGTHLNFNTDDDKNVEVIEKDGKHIIIIKEKGGEEKVIEILDNEVKIDGKEGNVMMFKSDDSCCNKKMEKTTYNGNKASLGVMLSQEVKNENGVETNSGIVVKEVMKESAAEAAGLQVGDVIQSIDGKQVGETQELIDALSSFEAGDKVKIGYERNGKKASANVTLKENANTGAMNFKSMDESCKGKSGASCHAQRMEKMHHNSNKASLGVILSQEVKNENGVETNSGIVVKEVVKESAAEAAGLQVGDVLKSVNEKELADTQELIGELGQFEAGDKVTIGYERNGQRASTEATLKANMPRWTTDDHHTIIIEKKINGEEVEVEEYDMSEEKGVHKMRVFKDENGNVTKKEIHFNVWIKDMETADVEKIENASLKKAAAENSLTVEALQFYPNPSDGRFDLSFNLAEKGKTAVKVVDMAGKVVFQDQLGDFSGSYEKQIDISANPKGVYFLQVEQGEKVMMKKIVVQ